MKFFQGFFTLISDIWRVIGRVYFGYFCLLALTGAVEGLTLASIVPMLAAIGIGDQTTEAQSGTLANTAVSILQGIGVEPDIASIATFVLLALALSTSLFLIQAFLGSRLHTRYVYRWQQRLISAVFRARWGFFQTRRHGDIINAVITESQRLGSAFYQAGLLLTGILHGAIYLGIAFLLSGSITVIVLVGGYTLFLLTRPLIRRAFAIGTGILKENADLQATAIEMMANAKSIKATATEDSAVTLLGGMANRLRGYMFANYYDVQIAKGIFEFGAAAMIAGILFASHAILQIDPAITLVVLAIFIRMLPKLTGLQQGVQSLTMNLPVVAVVHEIVAAAESHAEIELTKDPLPTDLATMPLHIVLRGLTVKYEDRTILNGIDLDITAGECIALVGASGSGKTTLLDALLGLVPVYSGNIWINSHRLHEFSLSHLRRRVGYMGQETILFNASVRNNVAWGNSTATEEEVYDALTQAAASDFVDRLPSGIDTVVGNRGAILSGGERQRIGLARALLGRPALLILDEATSALDAATEASISRALEALKGSTTIIIVAHRLSSVRIADRILVMDNGVIVESGNWRKLQQSGGHFKQLWEMQVGADGPAELGSSS